ncbi:MAG TPA: hypothetical protein VES38_06645 [Methylotenera sp.]|nr:hypothetical protein [Methylotenera sp.]
MCYEVEYMKAGRLQVEKVFINCNGDTAMQIHNPNASADYADYLARYAAEHKSEVCHVENSN